MIGRMRKSIRQTRAGQVLDAYLLRTGLSRQDLADEVSLSKSTVDKYISGERPLTWRAAKKIEQATGGALQAASLMTLAEQPPQEE